MQIIFDDWRSRQLLACRTTLMDGDLLFRYNGSYETIQLEC